MHCTIQFWTKRANSWWHSEPRAGWQQPETFSLRSMSDTPLTSLQLSQKIEEADFYLERSWSPRPLQAQPEERLISRVCWFVAQFPLLLLPHSVASSKHSNDSGSQLVVLLRSVEETITDGFQKWPMHLTRVPVTYKKQWASTASSPHLCFHHEQETSPNDRFCFLLPTTKRKKKKKDNIKCTLRTHWSPCSWRLRTASPPPRPNRGRCGTHPCCTPRSGPQESCDPTRSAFTHKARKISVGHSAESQDYEVSGGLQTFKEERKKKKRSVKMHPKKHHQKPSYSKFKKQTKTTNKCN